MSGGLVRFTNGVRLRVAARGKGAGTLLIRPSTQPHSAEAPQRPELVPGSQILAQTARFPFLYHSNTSLWVENVIRILS